MQNYSQSFRKSGSVKGLSNELMQLRKICQHPFLFESVEDKISPGGFIDEKLVRTSGKIELLNRILPKFFATNHRVSVIVLGEGPTLIGVMLRSSYFFR